VPYEGEVLVCIQETPAVVSSLEELNGHLQRTNQRAKKYIDQELEMLRMDPGLLTLQCPEGQSQSAMSVHEYKSDGSGGTCEQKSNLPLPSTVGHEHRDHDDRARFDEDIVAQQFAAGEPPVSATSSEGNTGHGQNIQSPNPETSARLPDLGLQSAWSVPRCFYSYLGLGAGGGYNDVEDIGRSNPPPLFASREGANCHNRTELRNVADAHQRAAEEPSISATSPEDNEELTRRVHPVMEQEPWVLTASIQEIGDTASLASVATSEFERRIMETRDERMLRKRRVRIIPALRCRLRAVGAFLRNGREVAAYRQAQVVLSRRLPSDLVSAVLQWHRDYKKGRLPSD